MAALLAAPLFAAQPSAGAERGVVFAGGRSAQSAPHGDPSRKVALIVGNESYSKQPLDNPVADARAMHAVLTKLGFEVITIPKVKPPLTNATREQIMLALDQFKNRLTGAGVGLFYFAGHGVQMDGRNYLLPVEVDMGREDQVKYNTISLDQVLETLEAAAPTVRIVILDACRNNPFERGRGGSGGLAAVASAPAGTLIAYATSPGRVALDGRKGENGLYTSHLLKALQQPGLNIVEVFMATRAGVMSASAGRQMPWETTSMTGKLLVLQPGASGPAGDDPRIATAPVGAVAAVRGFERRGRPEQPALGTVFRDCDRCPEMVVIPAGSFHMGSPASEAERRAHEGPQREVRISRPFAVGRFEVTFEEWEACLLDGGCDRWPNDRGWGRGKRPVIDVSWEDAQRYVAWLNKRLRDPGQKAGAELTHQYRLLSEAEWEYVARAGTTTARSWGEALGGNNAGCADCGGEDAKRRTTVVGSFNPKPWKVADMLGNVWEWVADCDNGTYEGAPIDGSAWVSRGNCALRGIRGGSWVTAARGVRSAARSFYPAQRRDINIGFRVATDLN
jgi:formylglycine-generating enzyme required for sulfatase activity